ncbi:MAG: BMC domain-containing protein [Actinobacteria bacterium]|nr:BMC domain-containing protein [Actinomycetota bacterium]
MQPTVAVLEFDSIARGIEAGDAMVKRAPLEAIRAGTVHAGKYVVLVGGLTADVEEAVAAGREVGGPSLVGLVYLPDVHPDVVASIGGARRDGGEALGVIETLTVAAAIDAADGGVKGARVVLRDLRMADGLGGKGYVLFGGEVAEVEAAVEHGVGRIAGSGQEVAHVVISQLHGEMDENLAAEPRWLPRIRGAEKPDAGGPVTAGPVPGGRPTPGTGGTLAGAVPPRPRPRARKRG